MRDVPPGGNESLPLTLEQRLNTAGRRFEAACKAGLAPPIEGFLGETAGAERAALLRELIRLDAAHRRAAGQAVSPADYLRRFPELDADWLDRELGAATLAHAAPAPGLAETVSHVGPAPAPPSAGPALLVPGYEVLGELGRGGMGVVYLARNVLMDRREVLKVVNKALLDKPGVMERFLREIRSAAMLRHNNVVQAYSAVQAGELLLFAMEYVEGEDLDKVVQRQGPLPVPYACHYVSQAAMGLQHAHEQGMVHRDVKPQNLMLCLQKKKHIVKVLDFGLAKARREGEAVTDLTGFGAVMGTPAYMAPEQAQDAASADVRADIYSLGCTLYFLLTGAPPFTGKSVFAILQAHVSAEPTPLTRRCAAASPELAAVVARMMAKDPARRYRKPIEVAQALAPFIKAGSAAKEGPTAPAAKADRPAALPVSPSVWNRPTVLPAWMDAPAGRAPQESKTEAVVPPSPRPAAPAPVEPARRRSSPGVLPALLVVAGIVTLAAAGAGVVALVLLSGPAPSTGPVSAPLPWTGPGPRPPGTGEPARTTRTTTPKALLKILKILIVDKAVSCAAVRGASIRGAAARRIAPATIPAAATTSSASGSCCAFPPGLRNYLSILHL